MIRNIIPYMMEENMENLNEDLRIRVRSDLNYCHKSINSMMNNKQWNNELDLAVAHYLNDLWDAIKQGDKHQIQKGLDLLGTVVEARELSQNRKSNLLFYGPSHSGAKSSLHKSHKKNTEKTQLYTDIFNSFWE